MIAWRQLASQKIRFATGVAGVAFAVILMLMQFGFQSALFDSSTQLHCALDGRLFVVDRKTTSLIACRQFPRARLYQALGEGDVVAVEPVYIGRANSKTNDVVGSRPLLVIAVDPQSDVLLFEGVRLLKEEGTILFDSRSCEEFGVASWDHFLRMENKRLKIVENFNLGVSFGADGNCLTSITTFGKLFSNRRLGGVDVGVIKLRDNADVLVVQSALQSRLGNDVAVLTREQLVQMEQSYWRSSTAIGFIFKVGVLLGLVVGSIIVYQILYADISDHLNEYATLLAMGYPMRFLFDVVFQEAIILAVVGFVPGVLVATKMYEVTAASTKLPLQMDAPRAVLALSLTVVMCCAAAAISSLRLRNADPADVLSGG